MSGAPGVGLTRATLDGMACAVDFWLEPAGEGSATCTPCCGATSSAQAPVASPRNSDGGNGWLRLYEFYPLENKVKAVTYSPYLDAYQTDADSQFDLALEQGSYKITFTSDGAPYATEVAASGTEIAAPDDPVKSDCTFTGWYADADCTSAVSFPYAATDDATLCAGWERSLSMASGWNLVAAGSGTTFR